MKKNVDTLLKEIMQGTVQVIPKDELRKKIKRGTRLKIKLGVDPTAPDLHLGHTVVLSKLKQFQEFGYEIIFLIGDFTARIGDPTGRSKIRPPLTEKEIKQNTKTYLEQVSKILDPTKITVRYNSEWLDKLTSKDIVELCAKVTLARLIERNDFAQRLANNQPIGLHELLYPLFQAYDSVVLKADIELGGTDQTFNLLMGRYLQEQYGQEPQVIITVPLLEGLDGKLKMSKSLSNAIGIAEPADQAFGKLMSISDDLMWRYLRVLLHMPQEEISLAQERIAAGKMNPMAIKKDMAQAIIEKYWSKKEAERARSTFEALFQKRDYSQAQEINLPKGTPKSLWIADLLKIVANVTSSSEAKRLIEAGAVIINGKTIDDFKATVIWKPDMIIKVGKHRIYKIGS